MRALSLCLLTLMMGFATLASAKLTPTTRQDPAVPFQGPVGAVDPVDAHGWVTGWAVDSTKPDTNVMVRATVGGETVGTFTTSLERREVNSLFGTKTNPGFRFSIPSRFWCRPTQTVVVEALSSATGTWAKVGSADFKLQPALKNFGFYGNAGWGVDHTAELQGINNVAWIGSHPNADPVGRLVAARQRGMKAVIDLSLVFFGREVAEGGQRPVHRTSYPKSVADYLPLWQAMAAALAPHVDSIAALYPLDEPYLNGAMDGVPDSAMKSHLESIITVIRNTSIEGKMPFRTIPIAGVFSVAEVQSFATGLRAIPEGYDWIGVDYYLTDATDFGMVTGMFDKIRAAMKPGQKLIAIPDAHIAFAKAKNKAALEALETRIHEFFDYIYPKSELFAGVFPFLYQSSNDTGDDSKAPVRWKGTKDLPAIKQLYTQIGRCLVGGASVDSAPASTPKTTERPKPAASPTKPGP